MCLAFINAKLCLPGRVKMIRDKQRKQECNLMCHHCVGVTRDFRQLDGTNRVVTMEVTTCILSGLAITTAETGAYAHISSESSQSTHLVDLEMSKLFRLHSVQAGHTKPIEDRGSQVKTGVSDLPSFDITIVLTMLSAVAIECSIDSRRFPKTTSVPSR